MGLIGLATFAVLAGCNQGQQAGYVPQEIKIVNDGTLKRGEESRIFPMQRGNQWVYDVDVTIIANGQRETREQQLTFRCTNEYRQGNKHFATIEAVIDGQVNERQQWMLEDGKGLFQIAVGFPAKTYTPPLPALRFPIEPDMRFQWEGRGFVPEGQETESKVTSQVDDTEEVDTGLGRMISIPVRTTNTWATGVAVQTTWWAPGVGIARYRQEARISRTIQGQRVEYVAISVMRLRSMSLVDGNNLKSAPAESEKK